MPAFSASDLPPFSLSITHRLRWRRDTYAPFSGLAGIRERSASRTGTRSNASCSRWSVSSVEPSLTTITSWRG
jgi:hypothetical protein